MGTEVHTMFWWGNLNERSHLEEMDLHERLIGNGY